MLSSLLLVGCLLYSGWEYDNTFEIAGWWRVVVACSCGGVMGTDIKGME